MGQKIVLAVIGTHGDVQPFVALAMTLKRRGFSPVLATTSDFTEFVTAHGIEFFDLGGDVQDFLRKAQFDRVMSTGSLLHAPALLRDGQKVLKEASRRAWQACQDASAVIFSNAVSVCIDIAEALHIPAMLTVFQPIYPTTEFPFFDYTLPELDPWLFRFSRQPFARSPRIDPLLYKMSYMIQAAQQTYWDLPRDRIRSLLGLKSKKRGTVRSNARSEPLVTLHAYSPTISPAPGDWSETNIITGFWRLDDASGWTPPPAFLEFLAQGDQPTYLGFGSMPWGAQRNTEIITKALKIWGGRAVIGKGWGGLRAEDLPDSVFSIDRAPHTKLFDYVRGVVHHGGAGTTHTGFLAGKPTFIVPQFYDQPYWGQRAYELGVGPRPVRLRKLTPQILASALEDLNGTPSYAKAAGVLGERLRLEDGTNRAVDVIEETIDAYVPAPVPRTYSIFGAAT